MSTTKPVYDVRDYGAAGDGKTKDTEAFRKAVDACAQAGGGTVWVPGGRFLTGAIRLRSNVTLHVDSGAVILASTDFDDFPVFGDKRIERWISGSVIGGSGLDNVAVTGGGTIDGQGGVWWAALRAKTLKRGRPQLIGLYRCTNVLLEGVTLTNSPGWTVHPAYCDNVTIRRLVVRNPWDSPNTDGINPDSCSNVRISDCHVDVGDDCIALKAGTEEVPPEERKACEKIEITNCTMAHGHGGVVIGSEMSGGVRDVVISNCVFSDTDRGIRIKTRRRRGGLVENVRVSNIVMDRVWCPFVVNMYYECGSRPDDEYLHGKTPQPVEPGTPILRDLHFDNVTARDVAACAGFLYGLPEMPIEGLTFSNIVVSMTDDPAVQAQRPAMMYFLKEMKGRGFLAANVKNAEFHNVRVAPATGPALRIENGHGIEIDGFHDAAELDGAGGSPLSGAAIDGPDGPGSPRDVPRANGGASVIELVSCAAVHVR